MRTLHLSAGTGSFFCGPCLRDNALVGALRRLGVGASLLPLYLPMRLDEEENTDCPLFFGGVNVYLRHKSALLRRAPRFLTRPLDAPRLLGWSARFQHLTRPADLGALTLSLLRVEEGPQAGELRRLIGWLKSEEPFNVICLSNLLLAGLARPLKEALKVPVIATMQGEDTFLDDLPGEFRERAWELLADRAADCDAFVAVSDFYRERMITRLRLPPGRVHRVRNGIVLDGFEPATAEPEPPCIGYLAHLCPPKGLHVLVDAFIELARESAHDTLRLLAIGSCTKGDEDYVTEQRRKLEATGLLDRARFETDVTRGEKAARLREMTLLSVPARYDEAFGLYLLEAMACGVPVVQPQRGAFPEIVETTGGGWIYEPGREEVGTLARALAAGLEDDRERRKRAARGRRSVEDRFGIDVMARAVLAVCSGTTDAGIDRPASGPSASGREG